MKNKENEKNPYWHIRSRIASYLFIHRHNSCFLLKLIIKFLHDLLKGDQNELFLIDVLYIKQKKSIYMKKKQWLLQNCSHLLSRLPICYILPLTHTHTRTRTTTKKYDTFPYKRSCCFFFCSYCKLCLFICLFCFASVFASC